MAIILFGMATGGDTELIARQPFKLLYNRFPVR